MRCCILGLDSVHHKRRKGEHQIRIRHACFALTSLLVKSYRSKLQLVYESCRGLHMQRALGGGKEIFEGIDSTILVFKPV